LKTIKSLHTMISPILIYLNLLHIRIKSIHSLVNGWTLSTWPSLFHDTDWDADIDWSKNRA